MKIEDDDKSSLHFSDC